MLAPTIRFALAAALLGFPVAASGQAPEISASTRANAEKLLTAALADTMAYHRLAEMTDTYGNRISGSASLERAMDWILAGMRTDGLANVRGEPVMVPHWVRGAESAVLHTPRETPLHMPRPRRKRRHTHGRDHGTGARGERALTISPRTPHRREGRSCCSTRRSAWTWIRWPDTKQRSYIVGAAPWRRRKQERWLR